MVFKPLEKGGDGKRVKPDTLRLMWVTPDMKAKAQIAPGAVVTREASVKINGVSETVTFDSSIENPLSYTRTLSGDTARVIPGLRGELFPDNSRPQRVYVNYYLANGPRTYGIGNADTLSIDELRRTTYYYELKNRMSIKAPFRGWVIGSAIIPVKYYQGYTAKDSINVRTNFTTSVNANVYLGHSWGDAIYYYRRHGDNNVENRTNFILGPTLGVSVATIDSSSTQSTKPLSSARTVLFVSPGVMLHFRIKELEAAVFVGTDLGVGSAAQKWDYHRRAWIGFGFGFNPFKLFG